MNTQVNAYGCEHTLSCVQPWFDLCLLAICACMCSQLDFYSRFALILTSGWRLIKSILLPEDDDDSNKESPKEPEPEAENLPDSTAEKDFRSKWEVLKHLLFDEKVPRSPGWDLLHQILISTPSGESTTSASCHTQSSVPAADTATEASRKVPVSAAKKRWTGLQQLFNSGQSTVEPVEVMHPGWQLVKEVKMNVLLCDHSVLKQFFCFDK